MFKWRKKEEIDKRKNALEAIEEERTKGSKAKAMDMLERAYRARIITPLDYENERNLLMKEMQ